MRTLLILSSPERLETTTRHRLGIKRDADRGSRLRDCNRRGRSCTRINYGVPDRRGTSDAVIDELTQEEVSIRVSEQAVVLGEHDHRFVVGELHRNIAVGAFYPELRSWRPFDRGVKGQDSRAWVSSLSITSASSSRLYTAIHLRRWPDETNGRRRSRPLSFPPLCSRYVSLWLPPRLCQSHLYLRRLDCLLQPPQ
jgi:hypothetical protein